MRPIKFVRYDYDNNGNGIEENVPVYWHVINNFLHIIFNPQNMNDINHLIEKQLPLDVKLYIHSQTRKAHVIEIPIERCAVPFGEFDLNMTFDPAANAMYISLLDAKDLADNKKKIHKTIAVNEEMDFIFDGFAEESVEEFQEESAETKRIVGIENINVNEIFGIGC
jgi:hypothetical protein